jgi:hypothetical protein
LILPTSSRVKDLNVVGILINNKKIMSEKSISVSKEQILWLREMYETYRALLEGTPDDGNAAELKQVKKHVLSLIKELEKVTK